MSVEGVGCVVKKGKCVSEESIIFYPHYNSLQSTFNPVCF